MCFHSEDGGCGSVVNQIGRAGAPVLLHGTGVDWIEAVRPHFSVAVDDT